ncbi:MAG: 23S rRNA pseudouridine synthase [Hyphomonadaceae bacterium]|nr:MAG: 23S rRNA pseudouridine synthase [Hyphomonadaceae bacterium]KAF0186888.1 MAG: 23S rRNA pseudouridine synthase [Hyphomonadaceae bacterium]
MTGAFSKLTDMTNEVPQKLERIAKTIARAGQCSRREAERWIEDGRVAVNGNVLTSPALNVGDSDIITIDGKRIGAAEPTKLWLYHKPVGLVTTHSDPEGRATVFEHLPREIGRVISVGRLDLNSEGLLLLTNDGDLARALELPRTGFIRTYRARAFGRVNQKQLDALKIGMVVEGVRYGPIDAILETDGSANSWISLSLREGKNREIRKVLGALGLSVNRLIRLSYGPFELGKLERGEVMEVSAAKIKKLLEQLANQEAVPVKRESAKNFGLRRKANSRPPK